MREFVCKECGKKFVVIGNNRERLYCNKSCKAKHEFSNRGCTTFKEILYTKDDNTGCWNCTSHTGNRGYPMIKRDGKRMYISRFMYQNSCGEIPDNMQIRHKCDNPLCINPDHLEIGTIADNMRDKLDRGRQPRGSKIAQAKLTEDNVLYIKCSIESRKSLAHKFDVSIGAIHHILQGRTWKHVLTNQD